LQGHRLRTIIAGEIDAEIGILCGSYRIRESKIDKRVIPVDTVFVVRMAMYEVV
jgi:hypothetical protein